VSRGLPLVRLSDWHATRTRAARPSLPPPQRAAAAQMLMPLTGGRQETLLSEVGFVLLPFLSTRNACALRLVCREFLAAVREHPWEDRDSVIQGSVAAWRACFPHELSCMCNTMASVLQSSLAGLFARGVTCDSSET
jgi:hypothetical protein